MVRKLAPYYAIAWRSALALLTVEIAVVSLARYVTGGAEAPQPVVANAFANPFLVIHVIGGVAALLVGPLQFVRKIRTQVPRLHRISGRIFAAACAVGAPSGFVLALGTTSGPVAAVGFAIPALLWPIFTWIGIRAILERRVEDHREWMLRSYAVVGNAITLRLMLPASMLMGIGFFTAYPIIAWLGWIVNLAGVEYYIRRSRSAHDPSGVLATA